MKCTFLGGFITNIVIYSYLIRKTFFILKFYDLKTVKADSMVNQLYYEKGIKPQRKRKRFGINVIT